MIQMENTKPNVPDQYPPEASNNIQSSILRNFSEDTEHDPAYDYYTLDWTGDDEPFSNLSIYMDKESEEIARFLIDKFKRKAEERGMAPEEYIERGISNTCDTEQKIYKIALSILNGNVKAALKWIHLLKEIHIEHFFYTHKKCK